MPLIDYRRARELVSIRDVLSLLCWRPNQIKARQSARGPCPLHKGGGGSSRIFAVNYVNNWWYCHKCKTGGNQLELYAAALGLPLYDATLQLCEHVAGYVPTRCGILMRGKNGHREEEPVKDPSDLDAPPPNFQ